MQESILTSLVVFAAVIGVFALLAVLSIRFWNKTNSRPETADEGHRCRFTPRRLVLKGNHGHVLRAKVHIDGPEGMAFTTYAEEAWWLALPPSGMTPQDLEIVFYTEQAPAVKRQNLTLRVFPADVQLAIDELKIELRL